MKTKQFVIAAIAAVLTVPMAHQAAAQKLRVGLASGDYFGYTQILAAQQLGYFKQEGVEVEATPFRGAGPAQEALAAGAADVINTAPIGAVLAIDKGVKQKVVAGNLFNRPVGFKLLVAKNSPIKTLKDLEGKKIGITSRGSGTDLYANWAKTTGKVNVQLIPVGAGLAAALQANNVDAIPMWATVSYRLIVTNQATVLHDLGATSDPIIPDLWVASDDVIEKRPAAIRGFLKGMMRAVEYMKANPAFGMKVMKEWTKEEDDKALALAFQDYVKNADTTGKVTRVDFDSSLKLASDSGMTTQPNAFARSVSDKFFPVSTK